MDAKETIAAIAAAFPDVIFRDDDGEEIKISVDAESRHTFMLVPGSDPAIREFTPTQLRIFGEALARLGEFLEANESEDE